jgi:hypothetical protein
MPMPAPLPDLSGLSLADIARMAAEKKLPPVDRWNPEHCGDSFMRIARDGSWYHEGSPIGRQAMVRLFATILRREADDSYVLVTPHEKLAIEVEDAPFLAVELKSEGANEARNLAFRLNIGDLVVAGPHHPLRFEDRADGPHPYLRVRAGLDALVARPVYYELAELALAEGHDPPGLWSGGAFFEMAATKCALLRSFATRSPGDTQSRRSCSPGMKGTRSTRRRRTHRRPCWCQSSTGPTRRSS